MSITRVKFLSFTEIGIHIDLNRISLLEFYSKSPFFFFKLILSVVKKWKWNISYLDSTQGTVWQQQALQDMTGWNFKPNTIISIRGHKPEQNLITCCFLHWWQQKEIHKPGSLRKISSEALLRNTGFTTATNQNKMQWSKTALYFKSAKWVLQRALFHENWYEQSKKNKNKQQRSEKMDWVIY